MFSSKRRDIDYRMNVITQADRLAAEAALNEMHDFAGGGALW